MKSLDLVLLYVAGATGHAGIILMQGYGPVIGSVPNQWWGSAPTALALVVVSLLSGYVWILRNSQEDVDEDLEHIEDGVSDRGHDGQ